MINTVASPEAAGAESPSSTSTLPVRHRWGREILVVLIALTGLTSLFYYEVVFLGRTILPVHMFGVMGASGAYGFTAQNLSDLYHVDLGASAWAFEPWTLKVGSEYAAGRFPLWNEHQGFGSPLLANAESGGLDLLRLPMLVSRSPEAWDFYYLLRIILGGLATYLFARSVRLAWPACFFLATAYIFSGHFIILGNNIWIEAYLLLPLIFLGSELIITGRTRLGFACTAISVGLAIFVGMPEVTLLVLLLGAAYGSYRLFGLTIKGFKIWISRAVFLVGAWVVGVALGMPLLLTLYEFVAHSSKIVSSRTILGLHYDPLSNFSVWFMPYLTGKPLEPGGSNYINTYVGATVVALAIYGLSPTRTKLYWRIVPFAALAAALLLAKAFGAPGINEVGRLPGLDVTLITKWSGPLTGFCLALLASVGVHQLTTGKARPTVAAVALAAFFWLSILAVLANWDKLIHGPANRLTENLGLALLCATAVWAIVQFGRFLSPTLLVWAACGLVTAIAVWNTSHYAVVNPIWGTMGIALICAAVVWTIVRVRRPFSIDHRAMTGLACCVLVALELFIYTPRNVFQRRHDHFAEPPYVKFLKDQQANGPFRIFAYDGVMFPDSSSAMGLDDIRTLDALYIDRYQAYINNFITTLAPPYPFAGYPPAWGEEETNPASNRWFDLTGVRYVITSPGSVNSTLLRGGLAKDVVAADGMAGPQAHVSLETLTIDGISKPLLFEHPPASVRVPVTVTPDRSRLQFSLAMNPAVWDPSKGDGVGFEVAAEVDGKHETLYRREIDPKNNPSERHWIDDGVDLSRYVGRTAVLVLTTDPLKSGASDWAGWGDIRLTSPNGGISGQYAQVYDEEVQIFENRNVLPRAFLVGNVVPVVDMAAAVATMKESGIEPSQTAVVEGAPVEKIAALSAPGGASSVRRYDATNVTIDTDAKGPALLVLADAYYPGWKATLDGKEVPIYPADLAFKGIFVPEGQHRVEVSYQPGSFTLGMAIALLALVVLIVVSTGPNLRRWARRR